MGRVTRARTNQRSICQRRLADTSRIWLAYPAFDYAKISVNEVHSNTWVLLLLSFTLRMNPPHPILLSVYD